MQVTRIRHAWPESRGFCMERPFGGVNEYILLHFHNPMHILCDEGLVHAKPNAFIIYDEHTPQKFYSYDYDVVHDWMHIKGDVGELMARYNLLPNHIYYPLDSHFITETVREMESEFFSERIYSTQIIDIKLNELIVRVAQDVAQGGDGIRVDRSIKKTLNRIRREAFASLESDISVSSMAKKANLSESRFYVIYKSIYGVSPAKDLILARIQRAKFLLSQNEYSVSEVAKMAGYSSEYHFIRQFKQQTGTTPGKYRQ